MATEAPPPTSRLGGPSPDLDPDADPGEPSGRCRIHTIAPLAHHGGVFAGAITLPLSIDHILDPVSGPRVVIDPALSGPPTGHELSGPPSGHELSGPPSGHELSGPPTGHEMSGPPIGHELACPPTARDAPAKAVGGDPGGEPDGVPPRGGRWRAAQRKVRGELGRAVTTGVLDELEVGESLLVSEPSVVLRGRLVARTRHRSRELRTLVVTAVLAGGVPAGTAWYTSARTSDLEDRMSAASGVPVAIGSVQADLGGSIRLSDVTFGELVAADAIEASVAMGSLLDGRFRADEIRVEGPRVAIRVDADGDSDVARLARRLAGRGGPAAGSAAGSPPAGSSAGGVRRIVVAGGRLVARVAGVGELSAEGVELVPDRGGVRIVTGPVRVRGSEGRIAVDIAFDRSAAELALPQMRFGRVLAVGGAGAIGTDGGASTRSAGDGADDGGARSDATAGANTLALRDVAAGRRVAGGTLEIRGAVDDAGVPRPIAVDVTLGAVLRGDGTAARSSDDGRARGRLAIAVRGERVPLRAFAEFAPHGMDLTDARASGGVVLRRGDGGDAGAGIGGAPGTLRLSVDGTVERVVVDHRNVAPEPFAIGGGVHGEVTVTGDAITVADARFELGSIALAARGRIRRGAPLAGELELQVVDASCRDLLASVPETLRGPLDGMALAERLGGHVRLVVDLATPDGDGATLTSSLTGGCRVTAEPPGADVTRLAEPSDQQLADGTRVRIGKGEPGWTPLRGLPEHVGGAFVSAEDGRFFEHAGFDLHQIARSLEIDLREHRLARGGSTISQQLIKNAFLTQRRSFDRKLQEAILTWRLEARLAKRQILERYLNVIELGPRVFGITAAARYWFDVTPRELTVKQAAFLAALTSQPSTMSYRIRHAGGLDADSAERVAVVLRAMRRDKAIGPAAYDLAKTEPLHFAPAAVPAER